MKEGSRDKKEGKVRKFFSNLAEKLDKKLEEKSKNTKCCSDNSKGKSCCS